MNSINVCLKVLNEIKNDKRTIGLVLFAPILILSLLYSITSVNYDEIKIGVVASPKAIIEDITSSKDPKVKVSKLKESEIKKLSEENEIDLAIKIDEKYNAVLYTNAYNTKSQIATGIVQKSIAKQAQSEAKTQITKLLKGPESKIFLENLQNSKSTLKVKYLFGNSNTSLFEKFASAIIGILVFFLVYLIGGINFLRERTSGTLEKILTTPIKRYEIILGYVFGFSIVAFIQTLILVLYSIYVLGLDNKGNVLLVFGINFLTALTSLSLGLLMSNLARNEFQFIQSIPMVILPQLFLCGLFDLPDFWEKVSYILPLKYTANALQEVIIYGKGIDTVIVDILPLLTFIIVFIVLNIIVLKKHRKI